MRRLLLAAIVAVVGLLAATGPAVAEPGSATLSLVAQSPWIADDGDLALELRIAGNTAETTLRLQLHRTVDRRGLLALRDGLLGDPLGGPVDMEVTDVLNSAGIASLVLQVGTEGRLSSRPGGVYPLTVTLVGADGSPLDSLITPLVHLPIIPKGEAAAHRPLLVGITLTVDGPPPLRPDGLLRPDRATLHQMEAVVRAAQGHPDIPMDVRLPPATVLSLARSDDLDHARLLADLVHTVEERFRLQSSPFVTADPEAWRRAGRSDVHRDLLDHGDRVLIDQLGVIPDRSIAVLPTTAVAATLDLLGQLGAERFIVSADHLEPRPSAASAESTLPARLVADDGTAYPALVADPDLARHLTDPQGAVSAAQYLLADMALLAWSDPTVTRMAVLTAPNDLPIDALTLDLVLGVLEKAPFLRVRPLPDLFDAALAADAAAAVTYDLWPDAITSMSRRATDRSLAEQTVAAYTAILGGPHPNAAALNDLLEVTAAAELDTDTMNAYLTAVYTSVSEVLDAFTTPPDQSVRLTGRSADIPFSVHNGLSTDARVVLVLQSDGRLEFPEGAVLAVVLVPGNNRIAIPVRARTSGNARLQVTVRSPDDARLLQLRSAHLMVRTTSLSGVGVLLFVGAIAVLAIWWVRAARVRSGRPEEST
ncbi:MAG: DUF6049 family protein [Acidimicrobiales bacterium]